MGLDYYCIGCHTDCMAFAYGKISSLSNPDPKPKWNQVHNSWHAHHVLFAATVGNDGANAAVLTHTSGGMNTFLPLEISQLFHSHISFLQNFTPPTTVQTASIRQASRAVLFTQHRKLRMLQQITHADCNLHSF